MWGLPKTGTVLGCPHNRDYDVLGHIGGGGARNNGTSK